MPSMRAGARCVYSTNAAVEEYALEADLVIGAVLIPGAAAPRLLSRELIGRMKKGAVWSMWLLIRAAV